jgi:DNA-binding CsgD family transcriptional regulator
VVAGRNLKDAAAGLGVSVATVRSQLARIFAKTGTDRQAELVLLMATALPRLLAP